MSYCIIVEHLQLLKGWKQYRAAALSSCSSYTAMLLIGMSAWIFGALFRSCLIFSGLMVFEEEIQPSLSTEDEDGLERGFCEDTSFILLSLILTILLPECVLLSNLWTYVYSPFYFMIRK